jgi:hypothetical protein
MRGAWLALVLQIWETWPEAVCSGIKNSVPLRSHLQALLPVGSQVPPGPRAPPCKGCPVYTTNAPPPAALPAPPIATRWIPKGGLAEQLRFNPLNAHAPVCWSVGSWQNSHSESDPGVAVFLGPNWELTA